jgi:hypothetical protein
MRWTTPDSLRPTLSSPPSLIQRADSDSSGRVARLLRLIRLRLGLAADDQRGPSETGHASPSDETEVRSSGVAAASCAPQPTVAREEVATEAPTQRVLPVPLASRSSQRSGASGARPESRFAANLSRHCHVELHRVCSRRQEIAAGQVLSAPPHRICRHS